MAAARTLSVADFSTETSYELRDTSGKQWTPKERVVYFNKCYEFIYYLLADQESELLTIGTGTLTTVAGTELYSLTTNTMGDFLVPRSVSFDDPTDAKRYWVHISTYDMMTMCVESDRIPYAMAEEDSDTSQRDQPTQFYIKGDYVGFLPIADAAYVVLLQYFANYIPIASITSWVTSTAYVVGDLVWEAATDIPYTCATAHTSGTWATDLTAAKWVTSKMPLKGLFNQELKQAVMMTAKNRQHYASPLDTVVQAMFASRAAAIHAARRQQSLQLTPAFKFR